MNTMRHLQKLAQASQRLLSLARLSSQALERNEVDEEIRAEALEHLLEKRERLAGEILKLSRRLQPVWHAWPECLQPLGEAKTAQALAWLAQIRENTAKIVELDNAAKAVLQRMWEETRQGLTELNYKSKVIQAYRPAVLSNSQHCLPSQLSCTT